MIKKMPMDAYVPESVRHDIDRVIARFKEQGAKIRLIRIGYDDFHRVIDQMVQSSHVMFTPTLCGYPVEWGLTDTVDVVAVRENTPVLTLDIQGRKGELS